MLDFGAKELADRPRIRTWPSLVTWRGIFPITETAPRKKAMAAGMSRVSLSIESTGLPSRLMARYPFALDPQRMDYITLAT